MLPLLHILATKYILILAFIGTSAGLFIGLFVSLTAKVTIRGLVADACLGLFGAVAALLAILFAPWPRDSITRHVNGVVETTTTIRYQHPERIALLAAITLPILRELYCFYRRRPKNDAGS